MPLKPKTPCKHPSCPALVDAGQCYCDKHKSLHPERPSPAKRGKPCHDKKTGLEDTHPVYHY